MPGLVLAEAMPATEWVLIESSARRAAFLAEAVQRLGLTERVSVVASRTEAVGRDASHRGRYDVCTARGFGPPPVTAEAAAPLLRVGGLLLVAEPPEDDPTRWPAEGLARLGMAEARSLTGPPRLRVVQQQRACDERFPRREGIASKRALWNVPRETLD